ncbi:MAG: thioesterase family protein [Ferruginibacter sp.]
MSRSKIDLPVNLLTTVSIAVRITDINYGNHTGNDAMVGLIQESRMMWLKKYGFTELNTGGSGLIISDIVVEFLSESFYGDVLEIKLFGGEISKKSFELFYSVNTMRDKTEKLVAKAKTNMVCYDYVLKKAVVIPEGLLKILNGG